MLGLCKKGQCQIGYLGSRAGSFSGASLQNLLGSDLFGSSDTLTGGIGDSLIDWLFEKLPSEAAHAVGNRIAQVLGNDKNALLDWQVRFTTTANYAIRKCECKSRYWWTLGLCCAEWGWSPPSQKTIGLEAAVNGEDFTPEVSSLDRLTSQLFDTFQQTFKEGKAQYMDRDGWKSVFEEAILNKAKDLGCESIEFVPSFE